VQINSAQTTPTPATADPILEPPLRSSSPTTRRLLPRYSRKQVGNDDLIASIDQVGQKLASCLSLTESALTTPVWRRPPSDSDLSEADRETPGDTTTIHQDALRDKFADQTFLSKAKSRFNILLNILQSSYIAIMFLRTIFSIFALQPIFRTPEQSC